MKARRWGFLVGLLSFVSSNAAASAPQFSVGAEQPVADPANSPAASSGAAEAFAPLTAITAAETGLVVWGDERNDGLFGARLDGQGLTLDPVGVALVGNLGLAAASSAGMALPAALASDGGSNVLLSWTESAPPYSIRAALAGLSPLALGADALLGVGSAFAAGPSVAWDGTDFVVAWASDQIRVTRYSPTRGPLDLLDTALINVQPTSVSLACQPDGSECLVAWAGPQFLRFKPGGAAYDSGPGELPPQDPPGSPVQAAWDARDGVYILNLGNSQAVSVPPVAPAPASAPVTWPSPSTVGCGPAGCFVAFMSVASHVAATEQVVPVSSDLSLDFADQLGTTCPLPLFPIPLAIGASILISNYCTTRDLLFNQTNSQLLAGDLDPVAGTVTLADAFLVGPQQTGPRLAFQGTTGLALWATTPVSGVASGTFQRAMSYARAYASVDASTGASTDASVGLSDIVADPTIPASLFPSSEGGFSVIGPTSSDYPDLLELQTLGPAPAVYGFTANPGPAAQLSDGTIVVASVAGGIVSGSTIDPEGASTGALQITNSTGAGVPGSPAIASAGSTALIAWPESGISGSATQCALVTSRSFASSAAPVTVSDLAPGSVDAQSTPAVAASQTDGRYLVVWADVGDPVTGSDIHGRLVGADGAPLGNEIVIENAFGDQTLPVAASLENGTFAVAWQDARSATTTGLDVYGAIVRADGSVGYPNWQDATSAPAGHATPLSNQVGDENLPSLATSGIGTFLLAYSRFDPTFGVERVQIRAVSGGQAQGASCSDDNQCGSLFCSDGVCCNAACDGACQECETHKGTCEPVANGTDPDHCSGTCDSASSCKGSLGQMCTMANGCASGFCANGVCCQSACDGGCETCQAGSGTCSILADGSEGAVNGTNVSGRGTCYPYVCTGEASCPMTCSSDSDCVRPYVCAANGTCQVLAGSACSDQHTLEDPNGVLKDCTPYACSGSACASSCASIHDCADGTVCDAAGRCIDAVTVSQNGGCAVFSDENTPGDLAMIPFVVAWVRRRRRATKPNCMS